jgi:hypothetical protein
MARKKKKGFNWEKFEKQANEFYVFLISKGYPELYHANEIEISLANGIAWVCGAVLDLKRKLDKFCKE